MNDRQPTPVKTAEMLEREKLVENAEQELSGLTQEDVDSELELIKNVYGKNDLKKWQRILNSLSGIRNSDFIWDQKTHGKLKLAVENRLDEIGEEIVDPEVKKLNTEDELKEYIKRLEIQKSKTGPDHHWNQDLQGKLDQARAKLQQLLSLEGSARV
jgi:hypothetical protein